MNYEDLEVGSIGFAQVGQDDYQEKAKFEGKFLKKKIVEKLGDPPADGRLVWKSNPHDFGTYYDMVLRVDENRMIGLVWTYFQRLEKLHFLMKLEKPKSEESKKNK